MSCVSPSAWLQVHSTEVALLFVALCVIAMLAIRFSELRQAIGNLVALDSRRNRLSDLTDA